MTDDGVEITFDESAATTVLEVFDFYVDDDGWIRDANQQRVLATDGDPITVHELGGIVEDDDGNPTPLRDDLPSIIKHVKSRSDTETPSFERSSA